MLVASLRSPPKMLLRFGLFAMDAAVLARGCRIVTGSSPPSNEALSDDVEPKDGDAAEKEPGEDEIAGGGDPSGARVSAIDRIAPRLLGRRAFDETSRIMSSRPERDAQSSAVIPVQCKNCQQWVLQFKEGADLACRRARC